MVTAVVGVGDDAKFSALNFYVIDIFFDISDILTALNFPT